MAVDRVERLLRSACSALSDAGVAYAIIGGNAVAAWVSTVDESAARTTKDVDILLCRDDLDRAAGALRACGLTSAEAMGVQMFLDEENPNPKTGVHVVFAGEKVRMHYAHAAPHPSRSVEMPDGLRIIEVAALVGMKLQSHRFIDRAHIQDLISVGLVADDMHAILPDDLRERLCAIEAEMDQDPG